MKGTCKEPETCNDSLLEMTKSFNGYHFCYYKSVKTIYNTEMCLAYLQRLIEGKSPEAQDPEKSEVSEQFLRTIVASSPVIRDLEHALKCDERGNFTSLKYYQFKHSFTLQGLVCLRISLTLVPVYADMSLLLVQRWKLFFMAFATCVLRQPYISPENANDASQDTESGCRKSYWPHGARQV